MSYVPNASLSRLVGRNLVTVVFLKWYLQLTFDGPYLNCDVWPTVDIGDGVLRHGDSGYRDALCSLLTEPVIGTREEADVGLAIEFDSGIVQIAA